MPEERLPDGVIARPRLVELLDSGVAGPVTLVSAPAGWGKTTLLGSWYRTRERAGGHAWVSVEPGDSGGRLWSYLRAALAPLVPLPAPDTRPAGPETRPERALLDRLAAVLARRPEPAVLVLDDLHRITEPDALDALAYLLRHSGGRLRLVIGARGEPALGLARRRLSGELTELRAAELAFTEEEAAELLAGQGLALPAARVRELCARTEGWPAGLRLAALAARHHPDPARLVEEFTGDHPAVADYLTEEVLAGLDGEAREALWRAGLVESVSGELLGALSDRTDGESLLSVLERNTGFLVALGTRPPAYRCHRMLGELLRAQLRQRPAAELRELHRRAAGWYAGHALPAPALRHALAAGDWALAGTVLTAGWPELLPYAEPARADAPVAPTAPPPPEAVRAAPELALACAAERLDRYDLSGATAYLRLVAEGERRVDGARRQRLALVATALRLAGARLAGDGAAVRATAARLRALGEPVGAPAPGPGGWSETPGAAAGLPAPARGGAEAAPPGAGGPEVAVLPGAPGAAEAPGLPDAVGARVVARALLGAALLDEGDLTGAEAELALGLAEAEPAGLARATLACAARLALVRAARGRLGSAEETARVALAAVSRTDPEPRDRAYAYLALATVALHRDRNAEARAHLELATGRYGAAREAPVEAALAALVRAQLLRDQGDLAGGHQLLLAARRGLAGCGRAAELAGWLLAAEADLRTAHGDTDGARELLGPALEEAVPPTEPLAVALSRAHLRAGDPHAAARVLPDWQGPRAGDWPLPVRLEAGLLDAVTAQRAGDGRRAARTLERVLELAEPEGFRRFLTRAEPSARDLLAAHLDSGTAHWPTLSQLVEASGERAGPAGGASPLLGEPLTERELTILRYLQSILSNVEIASELSLSVNTVKTHVRNIYRKLDATRRREAVRRARELRLL
ncbi:LuxR C-terminal-related transcriptional regulator [Micromonospora sp. NPDC049559]|uniref:LuxR C-terminal-related transcriptional regulator n=1 Tax=Micromonospora sp. NPDC049559 TaxID=3155923 RepID=UPI00344AFB9B